MRRLSLRAKLSVSFTLILLPLLGLALYTYRVESDKWTAGLVQDQLQTAQAIAALTDANFDQAFAFAWAVANDPLARAMNPAELDPHLQQLKSLYPQYAGVAVYNAAGDLVGTSTPWPAGVPRARDAADLPYVEQVLKTGQSAISPVIPGRRTLEGQAVVGVAVPIRNGAGGTIGAVSVPIQLEELSQQLQGMKLSPQQNIILTDPAGTAALITGLPNLSWEQRDLRGFAPVKLAIQGRSSQPTTLVLPFLSGSRIGAFIPSPKYHWVVGVTEQQDVALAPVSGDLRDWLLGLAGVAILSVGLIWFLSDRLVRPIRQLAWYAQTLGQGDLSQRVKIETGDELEELGRTFNQMANEIRAREDRLQQVAAIVESSEDAITSSTLESIVTSWNPGAEHLYGYSAQEVMGRSFSILIPADHADDLPEIVRRIGKGERVKHFETVRLTKEGGCIDVSLTVSPIKDASGHVTGMSAIARDITERRAAERERERMQRELERHATELQMANQELESFSYSVSHDLRAPLASIEGFSRLLDEDFGRDLPTEARRYIGFIGVGIRQMNNLITSLLDLSHLGRQAIRKQRVNMNQLVAEAVETARQGVDRSDLTIEVMKLPDAEADPVLLKQVWINLVGNALKFTRQKPNARIEIGCRASDGAERVYYVQDDGVGFDMEQADKLFGVFQRLHHQDEYEGNGVGLAIVARIVRRHGGRVWAEASVGKGATFYFTLGRA